MRVLWSALFVLCVGEAFDLAGNVLVESDFPLLLNGSQTSVLLPDILNECWIVLDGLRLSGNLAAREGAYDIGSLVDAWPLAWKGWLDITATIKCNSNWVPPETVYRIELTDKGRQVLVERAALHREPGAVP